MAPIISSFDWVIQFVCREVNTGNGNEGATEVGAGQRNDSSNLAFNS